MKSFTAILAATIIGIATIARADTTGPVTIQEDPNYNSDQIASAAWKALETTNRASFPALP